MTTDPLLAAGRLAGEYPCIFAWVAVVTGTRFSTMSARARREAATAKAECQARQAKEDGVPDDVLWGTAWRLHTPVFQRLVERDEARGRLVIVRHGHTPVRVWHRLAILPTDSFGYLGVQRYAAGIRAAARNR